MNMSFYTGAVGARQLTKRLDVTANNLANINNEGFKPKNAYFMPLVEYNLNDNENAVTELQAGAGAIVSRTWTDTGVSSPTQTGGAFDYAITAPHAFFALQDPATGEISYTRDGHFHRGEREDGFYLTAENGKLVLDENLQPLRLDVTDTAAMQNGTENNNNGGAGTQGAQEQRIGVYTFDNPSRLLSQGDNEFVPMDEGMEPQLLPDQPLLRGALESSGTDLAKEMTKVIECQRAFSYALRMVTTSDEVEGTINGLRG